MKLDGLGVARRGIPFYWHSVKKQVERVIREVGPVYSTCT